MMDTSFSKGRTAPARRRCSGAGLRRSDGSRLEGFLTPLPIGGAETSRLQCLQDAQGLIHAAADVFVMDHLIADDPPRIEAKQTAPGNTMILHPDTAAAAHPLVD